MKEKKAQLQLILDWIEKIIEYSSEMEEKDFFEESICFDAILMQLIHIWEISKKYEKNFWPDKELPIFEMIAMRNFIAHEYLWLNREIVFDVVKNEIPKIRDIIINQIKLC